MFPKGFRVMRTLLQWMKANRIMLSNTLSLVSTSFVTSILGFAYWWLVARLFPPEAVGLASAAISAMVLLSTISLLGLGTLLIGELSRQPGQEWSLISTAMFLVGGAGALIGIVFALLTPLISKDLQSLRASPQAIAIFASGVSLTAITFVLDQALIGLLRSKLQLWRNTVFASVKLVAVLLAGLYFVYKVGMTIYATWAIGNLFSLLVLVFASVKETRSLKIYLPRWALIRKLRYTALQHHILNLIIWAPPQILPVLVTITLSARANAWFYVSFTLTNAISIVLYALTNVLYAMNAADPAKLARRIRLTLTLALATCILTSGVLFLGAKQILGLFGPAYAEQATWSLRILALSAFPVIIKDHYVAICRIYGRTAPALKPILIGGLLELGCPIVGASLGNLSGLSLGWVLAMSIEAAYLSPTVYRAMRTPPHDNLDGVKEEVSL